MLFCGICDIFENEYLLNVFDEKMVIFWSQWVERYSMYFKKNLIYLSCFIGRIFMYKNINQNKYLELCSFFIKNKKNIIICSKNNLISLINNFYFSSNSNVYIICNEEENMINDNIEHCSVIIKKIIDLENSDKKDVFLHFGLFSKYIIHELISKNIKMIELGNENNNKIIELENTNCECFLMGYSFNNKIIFPETLVYLVIGYNFNQNITLPNKLKYLVLYNTCNNNIIDYIPNSVEYLKIKFKSYNSDLNSQITLDNLPNSITTLQIEISEHNNNIFFPINDYIPSNIKNLEISNIYQYSSNKTYFQIL